jgi:hypothetical protein
LLTQMVVWRRLRALVLLCASAISSSPTRSSCQRGRGGGVLYGHVVVFSALSSSSVVVPGDDAGGRVVEVDFVDGGERPNCVLHFTFRVLCVNFEGFVVFLCYLVVLFVKCKCSIYGIYMRIHGILYSRVDSIEIHQPLP